MTAKRKRQRTIILLALTAFYLVFELSFSAQLLDAAGGDADMRTIHNLEHWGRTLSGVALALLIWGTLFTIAALRTWRRAVLGLIIAVGASIPSMFSTQSWIVENRIAAMTDSDRRAAVVLEMTSGSIRHGDLMIDGLGLSAAELASPGGKAFVALLPMLTSTLPDVEGQGGSALRAALRLRLGNCAPGPDCLGSFEAFSNITWRRGLAEIGTAYALYADADARFADATGAALAHRQATDWNAYVDRLGRQGWNPRTVPAAMRPRVRTEVIAAGVPISATWSPADRSGFFAAVANKARAAAAIPYGVASERAAGLALPHGLPAAAFFAHPAVQQRLIAGMNLAGLVSHLDYVTEPVAVRTQVYEPIFAALIAREEKRFLAPAEAYGPGGQRGVEGRDAAERLWALPLALMFSLLGGLSHLGKLLVLLLLLARIRKLRALACALTLYLAVGIVFSRTHGIVTGTETYRRIERQVAATRGEGVAGGLHWIIEAETRAWPVTDRLRRSVLLGLTFGTAG